MDYKTDFYTPDTINKIETFTFIYIGIQMSQLTPYSRNALRGLKAQVDEENRLLRIGRIIGNIHSSAVNQARTTQNTMYKYLVPEPGHLYPPNDEGVFYKENIGDILECLKELFPDCSVKFTTITMAMGNDRKMHDVSDMGEKALAFVNNVQKTSYIIIDWA